MLVITVCWIMEVIAVVVWRVTLYAKSDVVGEITIINRYFASLFF